MRVKVNREQREEEESERGNERGQRGKSNCTDSLNASGRTECLSLSFSGRARQRIRCASGEPVQRVRPKPSASAHTYRLRHILTQTMCRTEIVH